MNKVLKSLLATGVALSCIGCGIDKPVDDTKEVVENVENIKEDTVENTEIKEDTVENTEVKEMSEVKNMTMYNRAAAIADEIYNRNKTNIMFSPTSLNLALGMVEEASEGNTGRQLNDFLVEEDFSNRAPELMKMADDATIDLTGSSYNSFKTMLQISNSLWLSDKYTIKEDYKNRITEVYRADIEEVSFEQDNLTDTVDRINNWCNEKTYEMIPEIITVANVKPETASVLVNTVYFESPWVAEWDATSDIDTFTGLDGEEYNTEFIKSYDAGVFYKTKAFKAFGSRYKNGLWFIGILPNEEGEFNLSDIDFEELVTNPQEQYDEVIATMPKLNFDTSVDNLVDIMKNNGVTDVFDPEKSAVTGMVEKEALHIDTIIQKTKIELDENGTKAAAATAIGMVGNCATIYDTPKVVEITLDRPFAFAIYDAELNEVVFLGKVVEFK